MNLLQPFSKSLWKSLTVKSLRIGWPIGLEQARKHLSKSDFKGQLMVGIFEDVFPAESELALVVRQIQEEDFEGLCRWETHHGKGLTEEFCDMENEAVAAATEFAYQLKMEMHKRGIWLPPRGGNVFYTWMRMLSKIPEGVVRELDQTPWDGMPKAMADSHTEEGRAMKNWITLLSGHYHQHRKLGRMVMESGWPLVREKVHLDEHLYEAGQTELF